MSNITSHRITFIDELRGISILLVVFYHIFSRWPNYLPWLSDLGQFYLFKNGYMGVYVFFQISGLVIYKSLIRSKNFFFFLKKRWTRLFPTMLVCTILIYISTFFLTRRPNGHQTLFDTIPGLTFIQPSILNYIFDLNLKSSEGSFWSLYVEFKYYIIFGLAFYFNERIALRAFIAVYALYILFSFLANKSLVESNNYIVIFLN